MASSPRVRSEETIEGFGGSVTIDTGLVAAAQAVEHYEMARCGALMRVPVNSTCRKSARGIARPGGRATLLENIRKTKMARSQHAYVRGNTIRFYEWPPVSMVTLVIG